METADGHNEAEKGQPQSEVGSIKGAQVVECDQGADSALHRRLNGRHLTMIGIGSSIGMGLWLGSGKGLANGGPAALFIGCMFRINLSTWDFD